MKYSEKSTDNVYRKVMSKYFITSGASRIRSIIDDVIFELSDGGEFTDKALLSSMVATRINSFVDDSDKVADYIMKEIGNEGYSFSRGYGSSGTAYEVA